MGGQSRSARPVRRRKTASRFGSWIVDRHDPDTGSGGTLEETGQDTVAVCRKDGDDAVVRRHVVDALDCLPCLQQVFRRSGEPQLDAVEFTHARDQFLLCANGDKLAMVHDAHVVGQFLRFFHVVCGVQDSHPLVAKLLDVVQDRPAALRVDADRGFVHDDQCRLVEQRDGDVHAALHAARVRTDPFLLTVCEPDDLQDLVDTTNQRCAAKALHLPPEQQVLARRQITVERNLLRDDADGCLHLLRFA